jgi:hypothetical protein
MSLHSGEVVSYDIEPFMQYGKHATDSAYPHSKSPLPVSFPDSFTPKSPNPFSLLVLQSSLRKPGHA